MPPRVFSGGAKNITQPQTVPKTGAPKDLIIGSDIHGHGHKIYHFTLDFLDSHKSSNAKTFNTALTVSELYAYRKPVEIISVTKPNPHTLGKFRRLNRDDATRLVTLVVKEEIGTKVLVVYLYYYYSAFRKIPLIAECHFNIKLLSLTYLGQAITS